MQILEAVVHKTPNEKYFVVDKDLWPQDIEWPFASSTPYGILTPALRTVGSFEDLAIATSFADSRDSAAIHTRRR